MPFKTSQVFSRTFVIFGTAYPDAFGLTISETAHQWQVVTGLC